MLTEKKRKELVQEIVNLISHYRHDIWWHGRVDKLVVAELDRIIAEKLERRSNA